MSSVKRRIIIEEYINGGSGIMDSDGNDIMGIVDVAEVMRDLKWLLGVEE